MKTLFLILDRSTVSNRHENSRNTQIDLFAESNKKFTCENGIQIDLSKKCNGEYDCKHIRPINQYDLSDEKHCCKFS